MSAAYTPGPLSTDLPDTIPDVIDVVARFPLNCAKVVARCFGPDREGNARLIAAAPDLLAAPQSLLSIAEDMADVIENDRGDGTDPTPVEITLARSAIAKATGSAA